MSLLVAFAWIALAVFVVASLVRTWRLAKAPLHIRWELYPVPHEAGRAHYGGSYFEEVDWWTKKRPHDNVGMIKYMLQEIFLQKGVHENNKALWLSTLVMHTGLYLLTAAVALVLFFGLVGAAAPAMMGALSMGGTAARWLLTLLLGLGGLLSLAGAVGLLVRRSVDRGMALFTTFEHRFNLLLICALSALGLAVVLTRSVAELHQFAAAMLAGNPGRAVVSPLAAAYLVLGGLFALYLPFTHMIHFMAKYFAYHDVRWGDTPNVRGSKIESQIKAQLGYKPTWAAAHVGADGQKTWVDLAVSKVPGNDEATDA